MNQLQIIGNLGKDPEGRYAQNGEFVCNFSVAVSGYGEQKPLWVRVAAWNKLGETCHQYLKKGRRVFVQGRLEYDQDTGGPVIYQRKDKTAGAAFEMTAYSVEFLDAKDDFTAEAEEETKE